MKEEFATPQRFLHLSLDKNLATTKGSRLGNCGNQLELSVLVLRNQVP